MNAVFRVHRLQSRTLTRTIGAPVMPIFVSATGRHGYVVTVQRDGYVRALENVVFHN